MSADVTYCAVADPDDPGRMTYWRQTARGLQPWPTGAIYAPILLRSEVPTGLRGRECREWAAAWYREHATPWWTALEGAVEADPVAAQARFAVFATRCACCGRELTDPASKIRGVGPECRQGLSDAHLVALAEAVARTHGAPAITMATAVATGARAERQA